MHGTIAGLRTDATARLADLERRRPEWQAWIRLLGRVLPALDDRVWSAPLVADSGSAPRLADEPLLHRRELVVDGAALEQLVGDLVETEGSLTVQLVAAVLRADDARISAEPQGLVTIARLAAVPLLHSCGRLLQDQVPQSWSQGYCPICGSWPLLAELRSLDRTRQLRCGRCGGDWRSSWLCCAYCGETDHERLGTLVLEGEPETVTVETCSQCRGYLKAITTLQPIPPFELLLTDLETVELDVAALDRGFARPASDGFPLDLRLTVGPR